ncbi:hypothetical protein PPROV_000288900 [Pycnococcus provasolii]|uniref:Uncharacterized protein n=1 Tax=Pycnococcus provasolii TaxID=41880 RepID=A0A830HAX6_9CHLO|nr:hypothetical protein PPROV_000288900 [Pycnococcus provasolii]
MREYKNLRTHGDLAPAANIHFEDKAKHLRKMLAGRFYNAKPVGEDCGEATPYCSLMNTLKIAVNDQAQTQFPMFLVDAKISASAIGTFSNTNPIAVHIDGGGTARRVARVAAVAGS